MGWIMCGICGYIVPAHAAVDPGVGRRMNEALAHRGPDASGEIEVHGRGALHGWLGHRRLSVVDLSDGSRQPMASRDHRTVLSFNGEIYNFRELRAELRARGHAFLSQGDTEVVLRAYEEWGDGFVERIDGMFALAIWDASRERLILARDRTGKKPLFYAATKHGLAFASELSALVACPWVPSEIDPQAVPLYLTYGYVPAPNTMYRGVLEVPPASTVVYDAGGVRAPLEYWSALPAGGVQDLEPTREVLDEIARLLDAATARRMVADVPLGALLSGGIDSSLVVGLMARHTSSPIHTFAIGFPEQAELDERAHARRIADRFNTIHTDFAVKLDAVRLIDTLVWHHGQPFSDSSAIPTYVVSELARRHVTVVLNGDGGDEVFGGYERFKAIALTMRIPRVAGRVAAPLVRSLPAGDSPFTLRRRAQRFLSRASLPPLDRYQAWISVTQQELLPLMLAPELRADASPERVTASMHRQYAEAASLPRLDRVLYANLRTYLPSDLSVKVDRMSMAHGLEARSPFLDTALIEYVARIPARYKVGLRRVKPLLRNALWPMLPEDTWNRRKQGFGVPMNRWFDEELGDMFADEVLASGARTRPYLHAPQLDLMFRDHRSGAARYGPTLWTVLMLERWLRAAEQPQVRAPVTEAFTIDALA